MILKIASEISSHPPFLSFDVAQSIAEAILQRIENDHYLQEWENE